MAQSAGAAIAGRIAWEYPYISRLLLINPATSLDADKLRGGLQQFHGATTILVGSDDPSLDQAVRLRDIATVHIIPGADHHFSGEHFDTFLSAAGKYLYSNQTPS